MSNIYLAGLRNTEISTGYAQKSPRDADAWDQEIGEGVQIVATTQK